MPVSESTKRHLKDLLKINSSGAAFQPSLATFGLFPLKKCLRKNELQRPSMTRTHNVPITVLKEPSS